jgi:hypothetical protein
MPFRSIYYELGGDDGDARCASRDSSAFASWPRVGMSAGGDVYGNSPGMEALGDVKQLQQEQLRKSQGIDYMTNPPLQVPTNLKNRDVDRCPAA